MSASMSGSRSSASTSVIRRSCSSRGCGVQDHLEGALQQFLQQKVETVAAGRTDAGVHATAQVVHLDTDVEREPHSWVRGTNTHLDPAARVLWATPVPADFHARYSARARTYRYLLVNAPVAPRSVRAVMSKVRSARNSPDRR